MLRYFPQVLINMLLSTLASPSCITTHARDQKEGNRANDCSFVIFRKAVPGDAQLSPGFTSPGLSTVKVFACLPTNPAIAVSHPHSQICVALFSVIIAYGRIQNIALLFVSGRTNSLHSKPTQYIVFLRAVIVNLLPKATDHQCKRSQV